ncbi:MAG TPA: hypothetical protein VML55_01950 [Planctomycetaceae bacterium]|nr:hypothetical protein [Planctomycetaceae bacterium]
MPETLLSRPVESRPVERPGPVTAPPDGRSEFDYRPMHVVAPVSLFLGVASFIALMGLAGLLLGLVGIVVGVAAVWTTRRSRGEYSGGAMAMVGLALSAGFFFTGAGLMYRDYVTECPEGYVRVNFPAQISERKFVIVDGRLDIHPDVKPLAGQKVFLKGWMWNTQSSSGLDSFILLKDNGKCCMGGNPAAYDMMEVRLRNNQAVEYTEGMIAIAGVLRMDPEGPARGEAAYVLEADQVARAKTAF